jgi:acetyl-CoA carboxylase biotin carboxylase subunit
VFDRVLVANRGEIAVRVIRALHELGIEAVAVYSTADRDALHVELADQAVCIGPPSASESYLRISNVVAAAETTACDAVHPGYGFLAENDEFVRACDDNDVVFIGPPADVVEQMGDKIRAKQALRAAGVPLVPGSDGTSGLDVLRRAATDAGFPVLLKAAAGGGGKGMRLVTSEDELEGAFDAARAEAEAAFGDGSVYVEKLVAPARHVEIQVLCDAEGGVLTLGERECSIQRRHQKLVEESPSPALDAATREDMEATVERACRAIGYRSAGTFEFLVGPDGAFYFIEVNCRLQVEHPVSELVTGIDIVREQIRIAAGEPLAATGRAPRRGHALEIRINAEDPARGFLPAPGTITRFDLPLGPGVRVDTAVRSGSEIPPYYDSLIAKLIVWDDTRDAAIARTERALGELAIEGIPTTRDLALDVLTSPEFRSGDYSTSTLGDLEIRLPSMSAKSSLQQSVASGS